MSFTPMKLKTVSFQLPGSVQPARAATAPARVTRHVATLIAQDRQPHRSAQSLAPPPAGVVTSPTAKPDLIADIFEDTKIEKPRRTVASGVPVGTEESKPRAPQYPETVEMREVLPNENERLDASNEKGKQDMRIVPGQAKVSRAKVIKPHNTAPLGRRLTPSGQITKMVYQIREQTNVSCLDYARWMKHDVAKLREHLVKMEDEIKLASKAKTTLDARVFDVRKCLSVNQQSISAQQKKSHKEDTVSKRLREETHVLSKGKRRLEQHLVQMKAHLWNLDSMRKTVKSKIAILSRALELDAQRLKVYEGPVTTRPESVSKRRHYTNACPLPKNTTGDEAVAQLCSKVIEMIGTSKNLRSEMRALVQSAYTSKAEAHERITYAVCKGVDGTKAHQSDLMLQKGRVKMQQNSLAHNRHVTEIALGVSLGPLSESHRSVSEKPERPLSRIRPGSAAVESMSTKLVANQITRQLSATEGRVSRLANSDTILGKGIQDDVRDALIDSRMLRSRKAFAERH